MLRGGPSELQTREGTRGLGRLCLGAAILCPLFLGPGAGWGGHGVILVAAEVLELPGLARVPPPPPQRGFLIAAFPPGGIPAVLESGAWSSGGLRMKGTTKDEMQPGELCRAPALTGILGQGERKQVLEKPFEFPFLGGLSALASSRDSSSSPCTFLFHPPQSLTPGCLRKPLLQPHASLPEMN